MKINFVLIISIFLSVACSKDKTINNPDPIISKTIVEKFGKLSTDGSRIVDKEGNSVRLSGMSLFWSQWGGRYYNYETIKWLRDDWKCTIIRVAMGIENGGYLENPELELQKVKIIIDACIELGIYVVVDWHDHKAEEHVQQAESFFSLISSQYSKHPNIIYEIYNEPLQVSWKNVIKPYSERVIKSIRKNDPENLIIVGTPNWSQDVENVIGNQIDAKNIAYSFHFYSSTHKQPIRDKANKAIAAKIPLFVSEWGVSEASGAGNIDLTETNLWTAFLEQNNLSWCNWSITNKNETSAAILPSISALSGWKESELSQSGKMIRDYIIRINGPIFESLMAN